MSWLDTMREQAAAKDAELGAAGVPRVACVDFGSDDGIDRWWDCSASWAVYLDDDGRCNMCRTARRLALERAQEAARLRAYRARIRHQRAENCARACGICGGPLYPPGSPMTRIRSDKVTCSARCRQARRRAGT